MIFQALMTCLAEELTPQLPSGYIVDIFPADILISNSKRPYARRASVNCLEDLVSVGLRSTKGSNNVPFYHDSMSPSNIFIHYEYADPEFIDELISVVLRWLCEPEHPEEWLLWVKNQLCVEVAPERHYRRVVSVPDYGRHGL